MDILISCLIGLLVYSVALIGMFLTNAQRDFAAGYGYKSLVIELGPPEPSSINVIVQGIYIVSGLIVFNNDYKPLKWNDLYSHSLALLTISFIINAMILFVNLYNEEKKFNSLLWNKTILPLVYNEVTVLSLPIIAMLTLFFL